MTPQKLIDMGCYLFPVVANGKRPAREGWQTISTNDIRAVDAWVSQGFNLGIDTGKSRLCVVDVDNKNGQNGSATWKDWVEANGGNTPTYVFKTPSGGFHIIYRDPTGGLRDRINLGGDNKNDVFTGIDVRARGGLIIAPGSSIDGKFYTMASEPDTKSIATVPEWVAAKIGEASVQPVTESAISADRIDDEDLVDAAISILESTPGNDGSKGSGGDLETYMLANKVKDVGISREMCLELMMDHWNDRCSIPWAPDGLQAKVWSAYASGQNAIGSHANNATAALAFKDHVTPPEQTYEAQAIAAGLTPDGVPQPVEASSFVSVKRMSEFIREGHKLPPARRMFSDFIFEYEATIIFSDMGVGKTALGVQIARALASGSSIPGFPNDSEAQNVLYCDFELSTRQLANRYADDGHFPDNMLRLELRADKIPVGLSLADAILLALPAVVLENKTQVLVIDNLTYMGEDLTQTEEAARLMKALKEIKERLGITMIVVAHTPKRKEFEPLSINDLGGSRMIPNFVDAVFAIGKVKHDDQLRYLKQLKIRSDEMSHGANNTPVCRLEKREGLLGFEFIECRREVDLIKGEGDSLPKRDDRHAKILELMPNYLTLGAAPVTLNSLALRMMDDKSMGRDDRALLKNAKRVYEKLKDKFQAHCGTNTEVSYVLDGGYVARIFFDPQRLRHIKTSASGWGVELMPKGDQ